MCIYECEIVDINNDCEQDCIEIYYCFKFQKGKTSTKNILVLQFTGV